MAKLFASETALELATEAMRIHGGIGYTTDLPVERYYRDAPLMVIGEGTNEIQKLVIARGLLARARQPGLAPAGVVASGELARSPRRCALRGQGPAQSWRATSEKLTGPFTERCAVARTATVDLDDAVVGQELWVFDDFGRRLSRRPPRPLRRRSAPPTRRGVVRR